MSEPLDVSLRVRMRYEAGGTAARAIGDIESLRAKATQLGAIDASDRLGRGLRALSAPAQAATRELTALGTATARFGTVSTVGLVQRDVARLTGTLRTSRDEALGLSRAVERLGTTRGVATLERDLERVGQRADETSRKIAAIGQARDGRGRFIGGGMPTQRHDFGNEALAAAGIGGAARLGMSGAAAGGLAVGAGVASVGAAIAKATREAISFETAMAEVRKAVNDITPDVFAEMERVILRTSRATGIAKENIAKLMAQAGFAGRPTEDLPRFAAYGAKAAVAFGMTEEAAGDALAKLGTNFKLAQSGIEDIGDGINVLADNAAAKEPQIIDFLTRTSGAANALKIAPLRLAAMGTAIISTGKASEVAGTGFNAFAMKLGMADSQSKDFQKGLRALGLNARQVKADLAANSEEGLIRVLERINKLPENKRLEVAGQLGGLEYADDLLASAEAVEGMRKALKLMQDQATRSGSVEKTFKIFEGTTQGAINRATTSMEAFSAKVGQKFTPAIAEAAKYVERLFGGMAKALEVGDRAGALADKLAKGGTLDAKEQAEVDADPKLGAALPHLTRMRKLRAENQARDAITGKAGKGEALSPAEQQKVDGDPALKAEVEKRERWNKLLQTLTEQRRKARAPAEAPAVLPRTGKRSDLADGAHVSLATYHDEVERSLDRTERLVRETGRRMREDLAIKARFDLDAGPFGEGARVQNAALGGASRYGGTGGSVGERFGGIGSGPGGLASGSAPGRFGLGLPPARRAGGNAGGGAPARRNNLRYGRRDADAGTAASGRPAARFGGSGGGAIPDSMMGRARELYGALREEGFNHPQSAAILGHAEQESGIGVKANPSEGADGIIHWRLDRLQKLRAFAAARGEKGNGSLKTQAAFMRHEMQTDPLERRKSESFRKSETVAEASAALKPYIRYGDDSTATRTQNALRYDRAFKDGVGPAQAGGEAGMGAKGAERMGVGGSAARLGLGGVDPRLTGIMAEASKYLPEGHTAKIISGLRPGDSRFHGQGQATDVAIFDKGGRKLRNYQNEESFRTYEQFAQAAKKVQTQRHPELNDRFRWGGYFSGGRGKDGAADTMHFDLGGNRVGMGGGSWEKGLNAAQRQNFPGANSQGMGSVEAFKLPEAGDARLAKGSEADERRTREEAYRSRANPFGRADQRMGPARQPDEAAAERAQRRLPEPGTPNAVSPRFAEPSLLQVNARDAAERAGGGAAARENAAPHRPAVQNFYGGFDEQATARRAVLEQNREVRRSQARALHDIGRVA